MSGLAVAIINGNLTADPELRNTKNGKRVCGFSVAVNEVWKNEEGEKQEEVSYFDISVFGKMAETVAANKRKGDEVTVHGRLTQRRWEAEGTKRSKVEIVADQVVFNGSKRSES